jgi:hypothetical protein
MGLLNSEFSMVPPEILAELDNQIADDFMAQGIRISYDEEGRAIREKSSPSHDSVGTQRDEENRRLSSWSDKEAK